MATRNTTPSKETVEFLYKGLAFFYPRTIFGEEKAKTLAYLKTWSGMQSSDFTLFVTNITDTDDIDEAAKVVLSWKRAYDEGEYPDATIPENLDELVASLEEMSDKKGNQTEKSRLAKEVLLQSQVAKEEGEIKVEKKVAEKPTLPLTEEEVVRKTPAARKSTKTPETQPTTAKETVSQGIILEVIKKTDLNPIARGALKIATLPFFLAAPKVASTPKGQVTASAQNLLFREYITSRSFAGIRPKALSLGISPKEFDNLLKAIAEQERAYPGLFHRISSGFGIQEIVVRAGVPQALAGQLFLIPFSEAGSLVIPRRSLLGGLLGRVGQQLFGGIFKEFTVKKTAGTAATKIATTIAKLEPHARIAALVMDGVRAVVNFFKGKGDKEGVGGTLATVGFVAGGFYLLPTIPILGIGLIGIGGLTGLGTLAAKAGGYGNLGVQGAGFGQSLVAGLTSVVLPSLGIPLTISFLSVPLLVAIMLFIINSGAYVVPPSPFAETPFGVPIECTDEKGLVSFSNNTSSPVARRAWEITADLYQGFWCFWNRPPGDFPEDETLYPPSYPELFNESYFSSHPFPTRSQASTCGNCMFWCTWLVQKSYRETGNSSLLVTLWSPTMQQDFERRSKFLTPSKATPDTVKPGSVIFFRITPGPNRTNHVAIVHSVNQDGINYVQSNAPSKDSFIPFNRSGSGIQNLSSGINVVGIGLP
jgi:hypothetical protein